MASTTNNDYKVYATANGVKGKKALASFEDVGDAERYIALMREKAPKASFDIVKDGCASVVVQTLDTFYVYGKANGVVGKKAMARFSSANDADAYITLMKTRHPQADYVIKEVAGSEA